MSFFEVMQEARAERVLVISDPSSGLRALIVLDSLALGPGVGGIRTLRYQTEADALADAARLAAAMTTKCALGGLSAGGAKAVVLDHDGLLRPQAFRALGRHIEALGGLFQTAGDYGTTDADLAALAETTQFVSTNTPELATAVGDTVRACAEVALDRIGLSLQRATVTVQGCGAIGAAVAHALRGAKELRVCDLDQALAAKVAADTGGKAIPPEAAWEPVDLFAPCARGGVIDDARAAALEAKVVCGGANNIAASLSAARRLEERGICFVPDPLSSSGAVIAGIAPKVMGVPARPLLAGVAITLEQVLSMDPQLGTPSDRALLLAEQRIGNAR